MDSFYDQPRRPPVPQGIAFTTNRVPSTTTTVPDVSMLQQNKGNISQKKAEMSYNAWKYQLRRPPAVPTSSKENIEPSKESLLRKHVRFEPPHTPRVIPHAPNFNILPVRPSLVNKQFMPEILDPSGPISCNLLSNKQPRKDNESFTMPRSCLDNKILQAKPFEKMYMANVPNQNLDLSLLEPPQNKCNFIRSNSAPESFPHPISKPFCRSDYTQTIEQSDELKKPVAESTILDLNKAQVVGVVDVQKQQTVKEIANDEPSVKDLLKIVQQQNQQIMYLQQQVSTLLTERIQQPQIEAPRNNENWQPVFKNKAFDHVLREDGQSGLRKTNKFAIDVMTSFEVSISSQEKCLKAGQLPKAKEDQATLVEIMDESTKQCKTDLSLKLDEPLVITERCPSPENSIHVDMKDFSSDEEEQTDEDVNNSMIGWTIYNNVMDQVNFMLKKSMEKLGNQSSKAHHAEHSGAIIKQVKEATLKHLQRVGVHLNNIDEDIAISADAAYSPTEVSFAVKQLLMKYLPDEQLAKLTVGNQQIKSSGIPLNIVQDGNYPKNVINRRPDFSIATVQYMKKYNLLNCEGNRPPNGNNKLQRSQPIASNNKMLDITALKQQPKLL